VAVILTTFRDEIALVKTAVYCTSDKFSEWENFRHTFESLVDSNDTISNTLKFHYLKSSDDALLINNLQISENNYIAAWMM